MYLNCLGNCTVELNGNGASPPMADLSEFDDIVPDNLYIADVAALSLAAEAECNALADSGGITYDDYEQMRDASSIITENDERVCCRGANSCQGVGSIVSNNGHAVLCSGNEGCIDVASIISQGPVLCITARACQDSSITSTDSVHCASNRGCLAATVSAPIM